MTDTTSTQPATENTPARQLAELVGDDNAQAAITAGWTAIKQINADNPTVHPGVADYVATAVILAALPSLATTAERDEARRLAHRFAADRDHAYATIEQYADQLRRDATTEADDGIAVGLLRAADGIGDLLADLGASPARAQGQPDLAPVVARQWSVRTKAGQVEGKLLTEAAAWRWADVMGGVVVYRAVGEWETAGPPAAVEHVTSVERDKASGSYRWSCSCGDGSRPVLPLHAAEAGADSHRG